MKRSTLEKCIDTSKIHFRNGETFVETVREIRKFLSRPEVPSRTSVQNLLKKFDLLGRVGDVNKKSVHVVQEPPRILLL